MPSLKMSAFLSVLLCGGMLVCLSQRSAGTPQQSDKSVAPDSRIFVETIVESGTLRGASDLKIRSPFTRTMTIVECAEDLSEVEQGDVILRFDDRAERNAVLAARAEVSAVNAALVVARARLASLETQLESAKRLLQMREQLGKSRVEVAQAGSEAASRRQSVLEEMIQRQQQLTALYQTAAKAPAFDSLSTLDRLHIQAGAITSEMKLAELRQEFSADSSGLREISALEAAAELEEQRFRGRQQIDLIQEELLRAGHEIERLGQARTDAMATFDRAEKEQAACTVVAPRSGLVVYNTQGSARRTEPVVMEVGGTVPARSDLFQMLDMSQFEVEGRLNAAKAGRVRPGQPVVVELDGFGDFLLNGTIKSVAEVPLPGSWPNTDIVAFPFVVELESESQEVARKRLRHGLVCFVRIDVRASSP